MKRLLSYLFILTLIALILIGVFYLTLPWIIPSDRLEKTVVQEIEQAIIGTFDYEKSEVRYFPILRAEFHNVRMDAASGSSTLETPRFELYFKFWKLLTGRLEIARATAAKASLDFPFLIRQDLKNIRLLNASLDFRAGSVNRMDHLDIYGSMGEKQGDLRIAADLYWHDLAEHNWESSEFNGFMEFKDFYLSQILSTIGLRLPVDFKQGQINGKLTFQKKKSADWADLSGNVDFRNLLYEDTMNGKTLISPVFDIDLSVGASWNGATDEVLLKLLQIPILDGSLEAKGHFYIATGEILEMRLTAFGIPLESIPHYWVALPELLPFNFGFSGSSDWDMNLKGTWDHLSIHANVDLTSSLLTYGRYFVKTKDIPMSWSADMILKDKNQINGDFSFRLLGAVAKGTLTDMLITTGQGRMNLITNKFSLSEWPSVIPVLQPYQMGGELKILMNWQGPLYDFSQVSKVVNVSLNHGSLKDAAENVIENVEILADYGPMGLQVKKGEAKIGETVVETEFFIYNTGAAPSFKGMIDMRDLDTAKSWEIINRLFRPVSPSAWVEKFSGQMDQVPEWVFQQRMIDRFFLEFQGDGARWEFQKAEVSMLDGDIRLKGAVNLLPLPASWNAEISASHLDLQKLTSWDDSPPLMKGNLFVEASLSSETVQDEVFANGQGSLLITEGSFLTFNLAEALTDIHEFSGILDASQPGTAFKDLKGDFVLRDGKLMTDRLFFISDDFLVTAEGEISKQAFINYRLNIYLSKEKTAELLQGLSFDGLETAPQFGPMPFLLAGKLDSPELQPDPEGWPKLLNALSSKKPHQIERYFLPEDFFAKREVANS